MDTFIDWLAAFLKDSEKTPCTREEAELVCARVLSPEYIASSEVHPLTIRGTGLTAKTPQSLMLVDPSQISEIWQEELDTIRFTAQVPVSCA